MAGPLQNGPRSLVEEEAPAQEAPERLPWSHLLLAIAFLLIGLGVFGAFGWKYLRERRVDLRPLSERIANSVERGLLSCGVPDAAIDRTAPEPRRDEGAVWGCSQMEATLPPSVNLDGLEDVLTRLVVREDAALKTPNDPAHPGVRSVVLAGREVVRLELFPAGGSGAGFDLRTDCDRLASEAVKALQSAAREAEVRTARPPEERSRGDVRWKWRGVTAQLPQDTDIQGVVDSLRKRFAGSGAQVEVLSQGAGSAELSVNVAGVECLKLELRRGPMDGPEALADSPGAGEAPPDEERADAPGDANETRPASAAFEGARATRRQAAPGRGPAILLPAARSVARASSPRFRTDDVADLLDVSLPSQEDLPLESDEAGPEDMGPPQLARIDPAALREALNRTHRTGEDLAQVAIVVDDGGYGGQATETILALDPALTLSILPHTPKAAETAARAAEAGFEILLHLPMESHSASVSFPGMLKTGMETGKLRALWAAAFASVPGAAGVNNHTGSKFTSSASAMQSLMPFLKEEGMFFVDSLTTARSACQAAAASAGVPFGVRDVFLDNRADPEYIRGQLAALVHLARTRGHAIGICHFRPVTAHVLAEELPGLAAAGVELTHVSELVQ